ncbi:NADP-dependent oxidoreductase [Leucobacter sp. GX24907]
MTRTVQFTQNGDIDQLGIAEVDAPEPAAGQIRIGVRYAGLNPVDWKILRGGFGAVQGVSGNGTDFSGVVEAVGSGVSTFAPGDLVFGGHPNGAQAEHIVVEADSGQLHRVPAGLGLETAGGLFITGRTAVSGVRALAVQPGETVFVSGATGGVGILAAQIARLLGARVLGAVGEHNEPVLRSLGIEPVRYGPGLEERLREAAPEGIAAAYSTQGEDELDLLARLGVPLGRTNSIGAGRQVAERGVSIEGTGTARPDDLDLLARAIAHGAIQAPTARIFAFDEVHEAYRFLREDHPVGKVLLSVGAADLADEDRAALRG